MTALELAQKLNGREYLEEITREECREAKASGLVVIFGASDDLMEFRGAIDDEVGAWNGKTAKLRRSGLVSVPDHVNYPEDGEECKLYQRSIEGAVEIKAVWCPDDIDASWDIVTDIPHAPFDIMEDGELYCRGIVIDLSDLPE